MSSRFTRLIAGLALSQMLWAAPSWGVDTGDSLPDFALRTFAGTEVSRATLAGRPALLVFWNTWCPLCRRELPQIGRLTAEFLPQGLEVVAVNTGFNDSEGKARAYWQKSGYPFGSGFDHTFRVGQSFGVIGVPTVLLVDAHGIVRYRSSVLPGDLKERLRRLVAETRGGGRR